MARDFDEDRFREAVLYIAWKTRNDSRFGQVKIAKTLFWADFNSFAEDGTPLTGARYVHWPRGPFPPVLYTVEEELDRSGSAQLIGGESEGDERRLVVETAPDTPHLEDWQRTLLDVTIKELADKPSWKVSDDSHEHPAWGLTALNEEIPYEAALVPAKPSPEAMELARHRFSNEKNPFG